MASFDSGDSVSSTPIHKKPNAAEMDEIVCAVMGYACMHEKASVVPRPRPKIWNGAWEQGCEKAGSVD